MRSSPSVVIPTLNEEKCLPGTLDSVFDAWPQAEVIVSDCGSADDTVVIAKQRGAQVLISPQPGRGSQMRLGADAASRPWILFLHADTRVNAACAQVAEAFVDDPQALIATFRLRFDYPERLLWRSVKAVRFDSIFTRFGDQGILVRASYYRKLGGFQAWPLFEDVDLLRRARRDGPVVSLPATVTTSARRFRSKGTFTQQLRNAWLLLLFLAGADPHRLARAYPANSSLSDK